MNYDTIISGGLLLDGISSRYIRADIGIIGEKIAAIGDLSNANTKQNINAHGLYVCPGFIDSHCHTDVYASDFGDVMGKLMQGVTTDICGLCGISASPVGKGWIEEYRNRYEYKITNGTPIINPLSFAEYARHINSQGNSTNMAMFVGNSNLRINAAGYANKTTATQLSVMKDMLSKSMKEGAFGLSTGLTYVPSQFSDINELIELSKIVGSYGGIYNSHMRNESNKVTDSIREVIKISLQSGCDGHISHLKISGKHNHSKALECLELIHEANSQDIKITFDVYPYTAGSCGLRTLLPPIVLENIDINNSHILLSKTTKKRIETLLTLDDWDNLILSCGYENIFINSANGDKKYEGKSISQISLENGIDELDSVLMILAESQAQATIIYNSLSENDLRTFLKDPLCMIGTDAFARNYEGPTSTGKPHPRNYGSFPKYIRKYLIEEKLLSLPEGIRKITSLPARTFGLYNRGILREGYIADITVFNPKTICETGNYINPNSKPMGIEWVLISGTSVVQQGQFSNLRRGKMLLHKINNN